MVEIELAHLVRGEEGRSGSIRRRFRHGCVALYYGKIKNEVGFALLLLMNVVWRRDGVVYLFNKLAVDGCGR